MLLAQATKSSAMDDHCGALSFGLSAWADPFQRGQSPTDWVLLKQGLELVVQLLKILAQITQSAVQQFKHGSLVRQRRNVTDTRSGNGSRIV